MILKDIHMKMVDGTSALSSFTIFEAEFVKDRWDAREIPGLRYPAHGEQHYISFTGVPEVFRSSVKAYVKFQFVADLGISTLAKSARCLGRFLTFFLQKYPEAHSLNALSVHDLDNFVLHLKDDIQVQRLKNANQYIWYHIHYVEDFLLHLERTQSSIKPDEPTSRIIWPHHYPRLQVDKLRSIKYIPQVVLQQLDKHIQHLPPSCIPIIVLLRASGWRISDVLYLKKDTCLEQDGDKYSLVGDIQKTRVLGHKIPITPEVAAVVLAQIAWVKQQYTHDENPQGWLFPASKRMRNSPRFRHGNPLGPSGIRDALDDLVTKYQIIDENKKVFHIHAHAFRHTKAVELLNNGMSLIMVQQWMAHSSPEMTLIYAKILDETMRTQWEKTVQQGIVQFNDGKPEFVPGKKLLPMADEHGFDPERVRAHRQNVKMALGSCLKTTKIMCKFVELPCFHCPAYVLTPDDLPALEAYEHQILERIDIGKQAGNAHWIEVNQKNLDERVRPAMALLRQGHIVAKTGRQEREYTDEEWEQRRQDLQEKLHE